MKITPVFGLVLALHGVVIALLIVQPGCKTTDGEPEVGDTVPSDSQTPGMEEEPMTTTVGPAKRPITEASSLDDAFNAGFEVNGEKERDSGALTINEDSSGRRTPTRPQRTLRDPLPEREPREPTEEESIPLVSSTPRFDNYTVQPGDSLWKIANDYEISLESLLEANDLTKQSVIKVGQVLVVPLEAPDLAPVPTGDRRLSGRSIEVETMQYTVQRGDTLSKIAAQFGTTVEEVKNLNNRRSDVIRIGETLFVPRGRADTPGPESAPETTAPAPETDAGEDLEFTHTVRAGENPSMIASRYGMSTRELIRLNGNFDPRKLRVGQVLKINPAAGMEPGERETPEGGPERSRTEAQPERDPNEPIRIRVQTPEPEPEPEPEIDPGILLDDVEEIPVLRVQTEE